MNQNFQREASDFIRRNMDSAQYFAKHGSPLDKAIAQIFLEAAGHINGMPIKPDKGVNT